VLAAGCGSGPPATPSAQSAQSARTGGAPVQAPADFGGTDLAWVELMIPMDEQLLPVLDLVAQKAADPAFVKLATDLRGVYSAELPRLRALGTMAGLPTESPHKGHKMPGLVDADRLAAMGASSGADFERQAVDCLKEHLDQLASLAHSELTNGTSPTVKAVAQSVADTRTQYRAQLKT